MSAPFVILAVEDDLGDVELVRRYFSREPEFALEHVERLSEALKRAQQGALDLILLDLGLPDSQGIETLERLQSEVTEVPVIVLTGHIDQDLGLEAVRRGAQDYLRKSDLSETLLTKATRYAIERHRVEKALRQSELRYRSLCDHMGNAVAIFEAVNDGEDFVFVDFNKAAEQIEGVTESEVIGKNVLEVFPGIRDFGLFDVLQRVWRSGQPESHPVSFYEDDRIQGWRKNFVYRLPSGEVVTVYSDETEAVRSQKQLRESEQKYRTLFEESFDGLFVTSPGGKILDMNKKGIAMFGYDSKEEVQSLDLERDVYAHPPDRERILAMVNARGSAEYEVAVKKKNGEEMMTRCTLAAVEDEQGVIAAYRGIIRDITERKISESLLFVRMNLLEFAVSHPLDELLQKTLDEVGALTNSPIGFYHFVESDQQTLSLQAWSTRTVNEFCTAAGRGQHYSIDRAGVWVDAVRERKPVIHNDYCSLPYCKGMPDGHAVVIRELVVPILRSDRIVAVLGIGNKPSDYTEKDVEVVSYLADVVWEIATRKRTEEALRETEQQYRTLFEDSIDGVYSVLRDGIITDANTAYCEIFGYTTEEMIGKDIRELYLDPADRLEFQTEIEKHGFVKDYEVKFRKRDGTRVDCLLSTSLHFGKDGSIHGYRGIVRDLTTRKALQRQLVQAQKMEAIGTLAGGVAHDFNNILQVAFGYSELVLGDEELPLRYRADLQKINESAKRGADLVQRLLTFSRKTEINPQPLDLNLRITELRKMLERTLPKMVGIGIHLDGKLSKINADKIQIDQILMNLAVNARDAMPDGGELLFETANVMLDNEYVKANVEAKAGPHVLLAVMDTGAGMDKETLEHIFEPFYTTKGVGEGTGLGLAMVHGIVRHHGGHIICQSEPGKGTTFRIYFPALTNEVEEAQASESPMARGGSETVLLVDDEEFIRDLGSRLLSKAGYKVITASNGKEALEKYEQRRDEIALVLLDLMMPEMGGKQCLEELLKIDPMIRVVIASGFAAKGQTREGLEKSARGFVDKPYNMKQVLLAVRAVLDQD